MINRVGVLLAIDPFGAALGGVLWLTGAKNVRPRGAFLLLMVHTPLVFNLI